MQTPDPSPAIPASPSEEEPAPTPAGLTGGIPRFRLPLPPSPSRPEPTAETPETAAEPAAEVFSGPTRPATSSPASTEPSRPEPEEVLDPKDLQAAVTQIADIAFVLLGQGLGRADQKARALPAVDTKWTPTEEERRFVSEPAARIAKRHLRTPKEAMDVIDGCLVAVGVGAFTVRGFTGVDPLTTTKEP